MARASRDHTKSNMKHRNGTRKRITKKVLSLVCTAVLLLTMVLPGQTVSAAGEGTEESAAPQVTGLTAHYTSQADEGKSTRSMEFQFSISYTGTEWVQVYWALGKSADAFQTAAEVTGYKSSNTFLQTKVPTEPVVKKDYNADTESPYLFVVAKSFTSGEFGAVQVIRIEELPQLSTPSGLRWESSSDESGNLTSLKAVWDDLTDKDGFKNYQVFVYAADGTQVDVTVTANTEYELAARFANKGIDPEGATFTVRALGDFKVKADSALSTSDAFTAKKAEILPLQIVNLSAHFTNLKEYSEAVRTTVFRFFFDYEGTEDLIYYYAFGETEDAYQTAEEVKKASSNTSLIWNRNVSAEVLKKSVACAPDDQYVFVAAETFTTHEMGMAKAQITELEQLSAPQDLKWESTEDEEGNLTSLKAVWSPVEDKEISKYQIYVYAEDGTQVDVKVIYAGEACEYETLSAFRKTGIDPKGATFTVRAMSTYRQDEDATKADSTLSTSDAFTAEEEKEPEVTPPTDDETEVTPPADDETEVTPPADDETEVTPPADDKTEVTPPADDETAASPSEDEKQEGNSNKSDKAESNTSQKPDSDKEAASNMTQTGVKTGDTYPIMPLMTLLICGMYIMVHVFRKRGSEK